MTRINQRHGVPKISGGRPFTMSRGKFLDGTVKAYYGPGQTANASPGEGVVGNAYIAGSTVTLPYQAPTGWPGAGMLLRVPQVVFLSFLYPGPNDLTQDATNADFNVAGNIPSTDPFNGEDRTVFYVYSATTPNLYRQEADRVAAVYAEVKAAVETLRPGRTFVEILDWQGPSGNKALNYTSSRYSHVLAPDVAEDAYLGLNFQHVHAGHFGYDKAGNPPDRFMWYDADDSALADPVYATSRARVTTAYPLFAGYTTDLYGPVYDWSPAATAPLTFFSISKSFGSTITPADRANALAAAIAKEPTVAATVWPRRDALSVSMLRATAVDLVDHGFSYNGTTSDLTSASLLASIAERFGFDPSTGKDVG